MYLCFQASNIIRCCHGIFTAHNVLQGNLPILLQQITRGPAYHNSSSTQLSFVSFLYCSSTDNICCTDMNQDRAFKYLLWTCEQKNLLMASVATYPFQYAEVNPSTGQKPHSLTNSALLLIFLYQVLNSILTDGLCEMFLSCSCVKVSPISSCLTF